jgi:hypothetical protein
MSPFFIVPEAPVSLSSHSKTQFWDSIWPIKKNNCTGRESKASAVYLASSDNPPICNGVAFLQVSAKPRKIKLPALFTNAKIQVLTVNKSKIVSLFSHRY